MATLFMSIGVVICTLVILGVILYSLGFGLTYLLSR